MSEKDSQAPPRELTGTVVRGVGLAGGGFLISQIINFAIYLVLARLATPNDFGQLAAGAVVVLAGLSLADSGLNAAVIQRRDRVQEAASTAVVAVVLSGILLTAAALAISPLIGHLFHSHEVTLVAAASSGWILVRAFAIIPDSMLQRRFSFLRRVVIDPLGVVVFGAVAITTTAAGMGVWGLVLGNYAQFTTMSVASWVLGQWRPQLRLASVAMWRELVSFGRHVMASNMLGRIGGTLQTALIGRLFGTDTLGQFRYGGRVIGSPLGALMNAGSYVLYPALSRISDDARRFERGFSRSVRLTCAIAMPLSFVLLPLGVPIALVLLGPQWREAGELISAMFAYSGARALVSITRETFKASGRSERLTRIQLVSFVLTLGLIVAFSWIGPVGVGVGISLSSIGTAVYATRAVSPVIGVPVRRIAAEIWPPVVASTLMAAAVFIAQLAVEPEAHGTAVGMILLAGDVLLAGVVYLGALTLIAPGTARELREILSQLRERLPWRRDSASAPESNAAVPSPDAS
jgi:O-antigen/teichoic acid export membrane protein